MILSFYAVDRKPNLLRAVLFQDCAVLFDHLPVRIRDHIIFGESFQKYRTQALAGAASAKSPVEKNLQVAMPLLSEHISTQHSETMNKLASQHTEVLQLLKETRESFTSMLQGNMMFRLSPVVAPARSDSTDMNITSLLKVNQRVVQLVKLI